MAQTTTSTQIKEQLDALRSATKEALKSRESARRYLIEAGMIKDKKQQGLHTSKR